MPKKKRCLSQRKSASSKPDESVKAVVAPPFEPESSESFEKLKSLNQMLVKETLESRQQVDSLIQSKASLETELTRTGSEMEFLNLELAQMGDAAARMELETSVVATFFSVQLYKEAELRMVIGEKENMTDQLPAKLKGTQDVLGNERDASQRERKTTQEEKNSEFVQIQELEKEVSRLNEIIAALEIKCSMGDEFQKEARMKIDTLLKEKNMADEQMDNLFADRTSSERDLKNALDELAEVKRKYESVVNENVIQTEANGWLGSETNTQLRMEIDRLLEVKKMAEEELATLLQDKTTVQRDYNDTLAELEEKRKSIVLAKDNEVLTEAEGGLEGEVSTHRDEVAKLKSAISKMEKSSHQEAEKIKSLVSEVGKYRSDLEQVRKDRDEMEGYLTEEKANALKLTEEIEILKGKLEDTKASMDALELMKSGFEEETNNIDSLKKQVELLQGSVEDARKKKSFWAVLSSATTLVAAVSVAYAAACGH